MRTILITAYAVNPYKGSEEGTGWNLVCQAAAANRVIAVTRKNNRGDIEKYMAGHPEQAELYGRITFLYFDLPRRLIAWKKGPLLSAMYFYLWQFFVAWWLKRKKLSFNIAHSLNFHSNWTPSFLWILGKPFVWGPVGNHPLVPVQYIRSIYGVKAFIKDRMLWLMKCLFWYADPFVYICKYKARKIFCVNSQAAAKLRLPAHKAIFMPAVASEQPTVQATREQDSFTILSVGRFVPLKGFDLAIRAFAVFYHALAPHQKIKTRLLLIGTGPEKEKLQQIARREGVQAEVSFIEWMPRAEVIGQFMRSSVYLFPSHEGAGMVVAEALSYGLPVVCLDNYGPGEYVHPDSALRVKHSGYQHTVNELAGKLALLHRDPVTYEKESSLATARFNELFRWEVKGNLLNEVYDGLVPVNKIINLQPAGKAIAYEN